MRNIIDSRIPRCTKLLAPTFTALKKLGGSGNNDEILSQIITNLNIPDEVADIPHSGSRSMTELSYQASWARTYLKSYGVITNNGRSVWSITPNYCNKEYIDEKSIIKCVLDARPCVQKRKNPENTETILQDSQESESNPDNTEPWKTELSEILKTMDPFGFERLTQRLLRECGFSDVKVTRKTGDGGIDGTGKLKINGIFSFNVAFQCKRYSGSVGAPDIRNFRGSLTTSIEKGVFITTGTFSNQAREEAVSEGKQQIDLIDGEEFVNKIIEYSIGVRSVTAYEIDEDFFKTI